MEKQFGVDTLLFVQRKSEYSTEKKTNNLSAVAFKWQGFDDLIIYT